MRKLVVPMIFAGVVLSGCGPSIYERKAYVPEHFELKDYCKREKAGQCIEFDTVQVKIPECWQLTYRTRDGLRHKCVSKEDFNNTVVAN